MRYLVAVTIVLLTVGCATAPKTYKTRDDLPQGVQLYDPQQVVTVKVTSDWQNFPTFRGDPLATNQLVDASIVGKNASIIGIYTIEPVLGQNVSAADLYTKDFRQAEQTFYVAELPGIAYLFAPVDGVKAQLAQIEQQRRTAEQSTSPQQRPESTSPKAHVFLNGNLSGLSVSIDLGNMSGNDTSLRMHILFRNSDSRDYYLSNRDELEIDTGAGNRGLAELDIAPIVPAKSSVPGYFTLYLTNSVGFTMGLAILADYAVRYKDEPDKLKELTDQTGIGGSYTMSATGEVIQLVVAYEY